MSAAQLRFVGSGGQGLILASVIIAEAALSEGKYVAQSQSYGPEARGGLCKAEAVLSDEPIDFPKVTNADFLLALNQGALEKYSKGVDAHCVIMADAELKAPDSLKNQIIFVPIIRTAEEVLRKTIATNIIALGAVNAYLKLVGRDSLEDAVLHRVPRGMEDLNRWAIIEGERLV